MMQRTEEWFKARAGHVTGSMFSDAIGKGRNGQYLKARENAIIQIVTERLTGEPLITSHGAAGAWGTDVEPLALAAYEARTGNIVTEVGFTRHESIQFVGVSPDGLIDDDGSIEMKCPYNSINHLITIREQKMPDEHIPQVQGVMWVTNRKWCDFISYDPRMPDHYKLFIQRIIRDEKYIRELKTEIVSFIADVNNFIKELPKAA